ncbi:MAG: hypothetical protein AOY29_10205 [Alcanivorax borkumensis]|nr:MAG: hypothetical protein AOY29_10205 [Alcanivorax borkumensis]
MIWSVGSTSRRPSGVEVTGALSSVRNEGIARQPKAVMTQAFERPADKCLSEWSRMANRQKIAQGYLLTGDSTSQRLQHLYTKAVKTLVRTAS